MIQNSAIFFDRDGVLIEAPIINGLPKSSKKLNEIKLCDGIISVCQYFKKKYKLIMITNQPDFERGLNSKKNILEINSFLKEKLSLDDIYVCFSDDDKSFDRKPNPGMLVKASQKHSIKPKTSYFVGDRWKDVEAGKKFGCKTIFIDRKYDEKLRIYPDYVIENIKEIFDIIDK